MKINNLLKMFVGALMMTFIISSCADDFTEEDLLQAQYDLQQQQQDRADAREDSSKQSAIDALNQAGRLLDFSVTVITDEAPVEGAEISATNQAGETASASTDANGNITFADISMGGHTIKMTSADHVDLSFEIDFGSPERGVHYEIIDGQVIPIETSESARIVAIPLSGMLTSTVKGKVTFESDVTNNAPEIPQDVTLRANLTTATNIVTTSNNNNGNGANLGATSVTFTQANIGSATVDNTTGEYVMTLPAAPGLGLSYNFLIPNIEADQTVAYSSTDGGLTTVDKGVAIGTFPAVFGASAAATGGSDNVYTTNTYANLVPVFSEPAAEGDGFTLDIVGTHPRSLPTNTFDFPVKTNGNVRIRLTQGAGYTASPVVEIAGGGNVAAEDSATAKVGMEWKNTGAIGINDGGSGYIVGQTVFIDVRRNDGNSNQTSLGVTLAEGEVTAVSGTGAITAMDFEDLPTTGDFWNDWDDLGTAEVSNIRGYDNGGGDAVFSLTYGGRVTDLVIDASGEGYDSTPTITLSGGTPSTAATAVIEQMAFQYQWAPAAEVTTPYVLLPETVAFVGTKLDGSFVSSEATGYTNGQLGDYTYDNITDPGVSNTVQYHVEVKADGTIGVDSDDFTTLAAGVTNEFFVEAPTVTVVNATHEQADVDVTINNDGEFTGLSGTGAVYGTGYTEPVTLTFENLDGTPASDIAFTLSGFSPVDDTQEVVWDGSITVTNGGSGFSSDINDNDALVDRNIPALGSPDNGVTIIRNIDFGPGFLLDSRVE